jgi:hypothetical protein
MDTITEDNWGEEVWGPNGAGTEFGNTANPKLVFYFGQNVKFSPFLIPTSYLH